MQKALAAAVAAMAVLCGRAEADVYTSTLPLPLQQAGAGGVLSVAINPGFDTSLGQLRTVELALAGSATSTFTFSNGHAPIYSLYYNFVQFYDSNYITQEFPPVNNNSPTATQLQETFSVTARQIFAGYPVGNAPGQPLQVAIRFTSFPAQFTAYADTTTTRFAGTLSATYDYIPASALVPEPATLGLLGATLGVVGYQRRRLRPRQRVSPHVR